MAPHLRRLFLLRDRTLRAGAELDEVHRDLAGDMDEGMVANAQLVVCEAIGVLDEVADRFDDEISNLVKYPNNRPEEITAMLASQFSKSKYLAATDFNDTPTERLITEVTTAVVDRLDPEERPALRLQDGAGTVEKRLFILNVTNLRRLSSALGNDMELWAGQKIKVWAEAVEFRGEMVRGLRCSAALAAVKPGIGGGSGAVPLRRPVREEIDDEIPF